MALRVKRVAVVGTGTIGTGWATLFASKGLSVHLVDAVPGAAVKAVDRVRANLKFLAQAGLFDAEQTEESVGRITAFDDLAAAVAGVDLVQEAAYENYETKGPLFAELDRLAPPSVVLASSSSGLLMTKIQESVTRHPERCMIAHPINPVHLVPLVELVPGEQTDHSLMAEARVFYESVGKVPVTLKKEVTGYLENRMTAALWREAIDLVNEGVASVEDVDRAIWAGPGMRYALMGPLLIYHLGGGEGGVRHFVEHLGPAFTEWWSDMRTWTELPPGVLEKLEAGLQEAMAGRTLEELAVWRDQELTKLAGVLKR
jgi:carnitine 3-dehydrogenase